MKDASFEQKQFKTLSNISLEIESEYCLESEYCDRWPFVMSPRSLQVMEGHKQFFSGITFERDQLERWKHHRCVQADDADRLICIVTFSGQVMTLTWGQIFNITFQGQIMYHSTLLDKTNTMLQNEHCVFTESKVITEKPLPQKMLF